MSELGHSDTEAMNDTQINQDVPGSIWSAIGVEMFTVTQYYILTVYFNSFGIFGRKPLLLK